MFELLRNGKYFFFGFFFSQNIYLKKNPIKQFLRKTNALSAQLTELQASIHHIQ